MAGPFMATILISESAHKNFFDEFLSICFPLAKSHRRSFLKWPPDMKSSFRLSFPIW
jgi:hypothetical protein